MNGTTLYKLQMKIRAVREAGKEWAKRKRDLAITPTKVSAELQQIATLLQADPLNVNIQIEFQNKKEELIKIQHGERMDLQQRAHVSWLIKGGQGSKFFAQAIKARQAKNSVMGTLDINGTQTNSLTEMKNRVISYFTVLYYAPERAPPIPNLNIVFEGCPTVEENAKLRVFPSEDEI